MSGLSHSLLAAPPFRFGSQRAWFPALKGTIKVLRLPTCESAVTYFVRSHRPRDPSCFVFAGPRCRAAVVPAVSRGRQWVGWDDGGYRASNDAAVSIVPPKIRTASFSQYGSKAGLSDRSLR